MLGFYGRDYIPFFCTADWGLHGGGGQDPKASKILW